jgi:hypothetical protein
MGTFLRSMGRDIFCPPADLDPASFVIAGRAAWARGAKRGHHEGGLFLVRCFFSLPSRLLDMGGVSNVSAAQDGGGLSNHAMWLVSRKDRVWIHNSEIGRLSRWCRIEWAGASLKGDVVWCLAQSVDGADSGGPKVERSRCRGR